MPHIILEFSRSLEDKVAVQRLVQDLHAKLASLGVEEGRIKTRAIPLDYASIGEYGSEGTMAHITLLLLAGRDTATKQSYGQALHQLLKDTIHPQYPDSKLTLEVRDMDPDTYIL